MSALTDLAGDIASGECATKLATELLRRLFDRWQWQLVHGLPVDLPGIGTLGVRNTAARIGRNVRTGEEVAIPAGRHITFGRAAAMKRALNPKEPGE